MTRKAKSTPKSTPMSLRAYAKRRGVSAEAVSKAVSTGRLTTSVVRVAGAPKIADPDLADREWQASTRPKVDQPPPIFAEDALRTVLSAAAAELGVPDYFVSRALREAAAARRESALADLAEFDVLVRKDELVDADEAAAEFIEVVTVAKTKLLGLASRVKQRLPHIKADDVRVIDDLVREALESLADGEAEDEEDEAA